MKGGTRGRGTRGGTHPRGPCPLCGEILAIRANGKPWGHVCAPRAEALAAALIKLAKEKGVLYFEFDEPTGETIVYESHAEIAGGGARELARRLMEAAR